MRKVIGFIGLAAALVYGACRQPWQFLTGGGHASSTEMLLAAGFFTLAIAVLIRD